MRYCLDLFSVILDFLDVNSLASCVVVSDGCNLYQGCRYYVSVSGISSHVFHSEYNTLLVNKL